MSGRASGAWLFSFIASEVMHGDTQAYDRSLLLAMRRPGDHWLLGPPSLQDAACDVTALGGVTTLTLLTGLTTSFLLLDGKKRMALFVCGSVVSGLLVSTLLKTMFQRPRPEIVPHVGYVSTSSFPSGHSMLSAVTYLTLGALLARTQERKRLKAFFLLAAAFLSFLVGSVVFISASTGPPMYWPVGPRAHAGRSCVGFPLDGCRFTKRLKVRRGPISGREVGLPETVSVVPISSFCAPFERRMI
jgi:undecaprenyl-diphosphatase